MPARSSSSRPCSAWLALARLESEVTARHPRHDRKLDGGAVVAARVGSGGGGGELRAILAEEVQLVARGQQRIEIITGREGCVAAARLRRSGTGRLRRNAERRQERRAGDAPLGVRLAHPRHCGAQIIVGALGRGYEGIEIARVEAAPPLARGPLGRGRIGRGHPVLGRRDVGLLITRTQAAGCECQQAAGEGARAERAGRRAPGTAHRSREGQPGVHGATLAPGRFSPGGRMIKVS
jgi:hypothetical protein